MTLIKYNANGYRPSTFNGFLDRFFNDEVFGGKATSSFSPQVDVAESEKEFEIQFYIPGIKKEDIKIDVNDDRITVSGERKFTNEKKEKNYHSVESSYGKFSRSFYLPDNVNTDKISASYADGVLDVVIPKDEKKVTKRTISIK